MIVEHEVIEQIEEEPNGRSIEWMCSFLRELGSTDPLVLLHNMWRAGYLAVDDESGLELKSWQCEPIWRGSEEVQPRVVATPLGRLSNSARPCQPER